MNATQPTNQPAGETGGLDHENPTHIYHTVFNPSGCDRFYCLQRFDPASVADAAALTDEVARLKEALERIQDCAHGVMPIHRDMDHLRQIVLNADDARWTRLYAILAETRAALQPGESEGEGRG